MRSMKQSWESMYSKLRVTPSHITRGIAQLRSSYRLGLSVGYGHDGPGVCLGDGQTEAEEVPSQGGGGDALLLRMPPYLT